MRPAGVVVTSDSSTSTNIRQRGSGPVCDSTVRPSDSAAVWLPSSREVTVVSAPLGSRVTVCTLPVSSPRTSKTRSREPALSVTR